MNSYNNNNNKIKIKNRIKTVKEIHLCIMLQKAYNLHQHRISKKMIILKNRKVLSIIYKICLKKKFNKCYNLLKKNQITNHFNHKLKKNLYILKNKCQFLPKIFKSIASQMQHKNLKIV